MATTRLTPTGAIRGRWLMAGIVVIVVALIAAIAISALGQPRAADATPTTAAARSTIVATTSGSGTIAAAQALDVPFATSGTVATILVAEGAQVRAGDPLATLDTRDLELQVTNAQVQLDSARLKLEQASQGNATAETVAAQQAQVRSAEAQLASAEAQLRSAQAQLSALRSPSASDIQAAELKLQSAQLDLQSVRDSKSVAKSRAQLDLDKAVQSLTQAQSSYSTALQNWQYVQESSNDPQNPTKTEGTKTVDNKLNDAQRQSYYDKYVQAEAALRSAEAAVKQAQLSFEQAQQDEATTIQQYENKLADAQRALTALRNPSKTDVAKQQASVDQARASVDQARASLEQATINLQKLSAPSTSSDIAIQQASVSQAEQSLAQARLKLEQATLTAPFDGIVTDINIVPGSVVSSATAALSLIDRSTLHVDLKLSENDVAAVQIGQPVALTIDALKSWSKQGEVAYISPAAEESNGVVTYRVRVAFSESDPSVRVGMTANLVITTATKDGALVVPNTALLPDGAGRVVQVRGADGSNRTAPVEIGLTDGTVTEIVSGLSEGDLVVTMPGATQQAAPGFGG